MFHPVGSLSAQRLAAYMGVVAIPGTRGRTIEDRPEWLIRYGTSAPVRYLPSGRTLNRRGVSERYSDRVEQLAILRNAGVAVPKAGTLPPVDQRATPEEAYRLIPDNIRNVLGWEGIPSTYGILARRPVEQAQPHGAKGLYFYRTLGGALRNRHNTSIYEVIPKARHRLHIGLDHA